MSFDEYKMRVLKNLNKRVGSLHDSNRLVKETLPFIQYCFDNFEHEDPEYEKCAIGILAKLDSQSNPDRYLRYGMNSCFEVHLLAGRIIRSECKVTIKDVESDILTKMKVNYVR